jgi:hypothetical protein
MTVLTSLPTRNPGKGGIPIRPAPSLLLKAAARACILRGPGLLATGRH